MVKSVSLYFGKVLLLNQIQQGLIPINTCKLMSQVKNSTSTGCAQKIITAVFTIIFGAALIGSFFLMPIAEKIAEETICKPGTIVNDSWGRRRTTTCIDKKSGQKIDVSLMQIFGCCPPIVVIVLVAIYAIFMNLIFRTSRKSDNHSPQDFRNF